MIYVADSDTRVRVILPDGSQASVSVRQARKCGYKQVDQTSAESDPETENKAPKGDDTQGAGSDAQDGSQGQEDASSKDAARPDAAEVRKWANENGVQVNAQGKIPNAVYEQYAAAH